MGDTEQMQMFCLFPVSSQAVSPHQSQVSLGAMGRPTVSAALEERSVGGQGHEAGGRGTSLQGQSGARDTPGHPPPRFRTCRNGILLDLQAARRMRGSGRLWGLLPLPSGSRRPLPCPRGGMQQVTPWQPQPLPRAHLTLTFPGAPSMPAGCHSKSKSYKQNQEKSLISIYSNEPCNNANHKSCSHCYSISVSYPSPHTFPECLASFLLAEAPSQPQGWPGRGHTSWGGPGPRLDPALGS